MLDQILEVKNLETRFHTEQGTVHAVNGVSFTVDEGEVIGVVGESGCGKSVTMLSILRLVASPPGEISGGSVQFFGQDLLALKEEEMQHVRGAQISGSANEFGGMQTYSDIYAYSVSSSAWCPGDSVPGMHKPVSHEKAALVKLEFCGFARTQCDSVHVAESALNLFAHSCGADAAHRGDSGRK